MTDDEQTRQEGDLSEPLKLCVSSEIDEEEEEQQKCGDGGKLNLNCQAENMINCVIITFVMGHNYPG